MSSKGSPAGSDWSSAVAQAGASAPVTSDDSSGSATDWSGHVALAGSDDQIRNPWLRYPLMVGSYATKGLAGMIDLPRTISSGLDSVLTGGANLITGNNLSTSQEFIKQHAPLLNIPSASDIGNSLGVIDNKRLKPEGLGENALAAVATGAPYGGASVPGQVLTGASSLAGEAAHELFPDSVIAPILAGGATGYGMGRIFQARQAARDWSQIQKDLPAAQAQAKSAEDALRQARDAKITDAKSAKDAKQALVDSSAADRDAFIAQANNERKLGLQAQDTNIKSVADGLGNSQTVEDAGDQIQNASRNWLANTLPSKLAANWKPVDDAIPAGTPVQLDSFKGALSRINEQAGSLEPLAKDIKPGVPARWQDKLQAMEDQAGLGGPAVQHTWQSVAKFRSMLGDFMSNPQAIKDIGQQNLSALYASLTDDMRSVAKAQGAGAQFDQANAASRSLYGKAEGVFGKAVSGTKPSIADDPLPGRTAQNFLNRAQSDASEVQTLREEVPAAADHLASVAVRTGAWPKLSPEAQAALIPDAERRSLVNYSLKAKDDINEASDLQIGNAKSNHANNLKLAAQQQSDANWQSTSSFMAARTAKESAAEKVQQIQQQYNQMEAQRAAAGGWGQEAKDVVHGLFGGGAVAAGVRHGAHMLEDLGMHGVSPIAAGIAAGTLSYTVPKLVRGTRNIITDLATNPSSQRATALGATVGSAWQPQLDSRQKTNPFLSPSP